MAATRTVEEKVQEADKVFTLHPWIYACFAPFPRTSVHGHRILLFFLCIDLKVF